LAFRWAKAGYRILIGSRTPEKARTAAQNLTEQLGGNVSIEGMGNLPAAQQADIAVLTVPYNAQRETLERVKVALQGKILVNASVPLVPPNISTAQMPSAGSAAQEAREILGEGVEIVGAFQNISFELLMGNEEVACDVLVTGTSKLARAEVLKLVKAAGLTGWDAGSLENAAVVEGLTSLLIHINKQYGSKHAGITITGITKK
jgi:NADPH-dependent F420 reductase